MDSWKRKLRMGMVGGGPGAFIGAVHRRCAAMDGQIAVVAGCFSQTPEKTKQTGKELYLDPERCYATDQEMAAAKAKLPADKRIDFVSIVTPNIDRRVGRLDLLVNNAGVQTWSPLLKLRE